MDIGFDPLTKDRPDIWRHKLVSGLVSLVIGLAPAGIIGSYENTRNMTPVDIAAPLQPSTIHTGPFRLNYPALYTIDYVVARTVSYSKLECLLGISEDTNKCPNGQPKIAASWILRSGSKLVAEGFTNWWTWAGSSVDNLYAGIGTFTVRPGEYGDYSLDITIKNDMSSLAATHPHLIVAVHPGDAMRYLVLDLFATLLAVVLIPIGLWKVARGCLRR